jgi:PST family polysaccharide transporter
MAFKLEEDKLRLLKNFISLLILQGTNYLIPLIMFPYLVRVLGAEKFGLIMFAQAFIQYFVILTNYGFNLSATRDVAIYREDKRKLAEIFSAVMFIKLILLALSLILLSIIVFYFDKFRKDWLIYYLTFGIVIGHVLFPVWFFQGVENMKYITFLNLISKFIQVVFVFIFIHKSSDYIYFPLLNSVSYCAIGFLALFIIFKKFKIYFVFPSFQLIKYQLKEGWYIFISTVAISLYTISNTFILGLFTNNIIVGYYSAAEKLIKAVQGLISAFSQALYPYISKLMRQSKAKGIQFIQKITFLVGGISFVLSLNIFIFAEFIIKLIFGIENIQIILVLKILSFIPFIVALSNIFGIQTMLTLGYKKDFTKILIIASIINVTLNLILVPFYYQIGTSISVVITELFVTIAMYIFLQKKGINILEGKIV